MLENFTKKPIHAATVFGIFPQTLDFSITRDKKPGSEIEKSGHKGRNNKIFEKHQQKAIHHFIQSLLAYNIQPTHRVVLNTITALKQAQTSNKNHILPAGLVINGKKLFIKCTTHQVYYSSNVLLIAY